MELSKATLIDHIGWRLWRAAAVWKKRFAEEMVNAGHGWYAEARSSVIPFIAAQGTRQSDIAKAMGLTKQAVQQLVDDLEREGVVMRVPDPADRRGKLVVFSEKGLAAQRDAVIVKRKIENEFRAALGPEKFDQLFELLKNVAPD